MSLNLKQKQRTAAELQQNYKRLGRPEAEVLTALRFTSEQLDAALHVTGAANGYDVWKLRDYLVEQLQAQGKTVTPFSVLKENIWFGYEKTW